MAFPAAICREIWVRTRLLLRQIAAETAAARQLWRAHPEMGGKMPRTELTRTKFFAISMAKEVLEDALPPLIIEGVKIVSQKRVTIRVPEEPEKDGFRIVLRFAAIEIPESVRIEAVVTCTMATTWVDGLHPESTSCIFSGRKLPGLVEAAYDYYKIGRIRGDLWTPSCRFRMYG